MRSAELGPDPPLVELLGIAGSLRRDSLNKRLLDAARVRVPEATTLTLHDGLADVPVFDEDREAAGTDAAVARLRDAVARCDGLLIATPEYNQSIPGGLKNAIDWLSRFEPPVFDGKPVAVMGASAGPWGTRLAQAALRQTLTACGALLMPAPQLYVRSAGDAFDASGALRDERVARELGALLRAFRQFAAAARVIREPEVIR